MEKLNYFILALFFFIIFIQFNNSFACTRVVYQGPNGTIINSPFYGLERRYGNKPLDFSNRYGT